MGRCAENPGAGPDALLDIASQRGEAMRRDDRCGRGARGASAASLVISLAFLSGVGQAVGIRAGGLAASGARPPGHAAQRALAAAPACAPARHRVDNFAPAVGHRRTVALTFDDGPGPSTPEILS